MATSQIRRVPTGYIHVVRVFGTDPLKTGILRGPTLASVFEGCPSCTVILSDIYSSGQEKVFFIEK